MRPFPYQVIKQLLDFFNIISSQVSELYEIVKKWESMSDVLPQIVDRLTTLKDIHEQG